MHDVHWGAFANPSPKQRDAAPPLKGEGVGGGAIASPFAVGVGMKRFPKCQRRQKQNDSLTALVRPGAGSLPGMACVS